MFAQLGPADVELDGAELCKTPVVYAWMRDEQLLYVGSGGSIRRPFGREHMRLRTARAGDKVFIWLMPTMRAALESEARLIATHRPLLNRSVKPWVLLSMPKKDAARLKTLREAAALTQAEAARECGLHLRSYQRLESGETPGVRRSYLTALEQAAAKKRG